jgi:peptide-methionine (S)-S-oxide reductase
VSLDPITRTVSATLLLAVAFAAPSTAARNASPAAGGTAPKAAAAPAPAPRTEVATFAGGCFWCMETQFEQRPGVISVVSGYTGGHTVHPTYEEVGSGSTGHMESVEIRFDPARISYAQLLDLFWHSIDPTQGNGQFCDHGSEYRSAIFVHGEKQRQLAEESKRRLEASHVLKRPIVTTIVAAGPFYRAEEYHQDFWKKDPARYHEYREGCGRDRRLRELWGKAAVVPLVH